MKRLLSRAAPAGLLASGLAAVALSVAPAAPALRAGRGCGESGRPIVVARVHPLGAQPSSIIQITESGRAIVLPVTGPVAPPQIDFASPCDGSPSVSRGPARLVHPFRGRGLRAPATNLRVTRPAVTGIGGRLLGGSNCPVGGVADCQPPHPVQGKIRIDAVSGTRDNPAPPSLVAIVDTDAWGRFRTAELNPGRYLLTPVVDDPSGFPVAKPVEVEVKAGVVTHVDVILDNGIR